MFPMQMMVIRPIERIKATRAWTRPDFADRGELPYTLQGTSFKNASLAGKPWKDKNGRPITQFDEMSDAEANTHTMTVGWQEDWDLMLMEDDVCYAYLGCETNRPSAANGGYEYHVKKHCPDHGTWISLYWATTYVPFKPYRAATGSNRIIDLHEVDGACTVKLIDPADGNIETVTASMLTDTDDLEHRPTVQSGTVAAHHGTVDTTSNIALKLAGSINSPVFEALKVGSATANAYDPTSVRTRWEDEKTWNVPYWASCYIYGTNYYGIDYSEDGKMKLKAVPIYDYLTKQAGFIDEASPNNRLIFSQGRRPFKPVFDDGFVIESE